MSGAVGRGSAAITVGELNALDDAAFLRATAPFFEGAPRYLHRLAAARPFRSRAAMFRQARAIAQAMTVPEQIELLEAHPRIGADPAEISALSYTEQGYDRAPAQADAEVARRLHELNEAYEAKFGFRFVVFVAGRPRSAIVSLLEEALEADRDAEMRRALDDVVAIAEHRMGQAGR